MCILCKDFGGEFISVSFLASRSCLHSVVCDSIVHLQRQRSGTCQSPPLTHTLSIVMSPSLTLPLLQGHHDYIGPI